MMGWPTVRAWALACCEGDESQHPMWPHWVQRRRCTHHPGSAPLRHSRQPVPLGVADRLIPGMGRSSMRSSISIAPLLLRSSRLLCCRRHSGRISALGMTESRRNPEPRYSSDVGGECLLETTRTHPLSPMSLREYRERHPTNEPERQRPWINRFRSC
jgi:hypothetical protein